MYNGLESNNKGSYFAIRDTLFGDMPISAWNGGNSPNEPWISFQRVEKNLELGKNQAAIEELERITITPGLESRHYVQAWHFLKQLGVKPPDTRAKEVCGVVVEVSTEQGLDIVAAYADHSARYYNYSGAAVIWENPDGSLMKETEHLLSAGRDIVHLIGPWEDERPGAPPAGQARVSMLTPSGLHFGQAPFGALANDQMGGPIIQAAIDLMEALIGKSEEASA